MPNNEKVEGGLEFYYGAKGITVSPQNIEGSLHIWQTALTDNTLIHHIVVQKSKAEEAGLTWITASQFFAAYSDTPESVIKKVLEELRYPTTRKKGFVYYSEALGLTTFPQCENGAVRLERAAETVSDGSYRFDVAPYRNGEFKSDTGDHFFINSRSFRDAVEEYKALWPVSIRKPKNAIKR